MVNIPLKAIESKSKSLIFLMIKHVLGRYDGYFHLQSHNISHPEISRLRQSYSITFSLQLDSRKYVIVRTLNPDQPQGFLSAFLLQNLRVKGFQTRIGFLAMTTHV